MITQPYSMIVGYLPRSGVEVARRRSSSTRWRSGIVGGSSASPRPAAAWRCCAARRVGGWRTGARFFKTTQLSTAAKALLALYVADAPLRDVLLTVLGAEDPLMEVKEAYSGFQNRMIPIIRIPRRGANLNNNTG